MGKYRSATILPHYAATTARTDTIDLDVTDPISALQVVFKHKSAGTAISGDIAGDVSKIEVVDGSDVIASLSGKEAQALEFYTTGKSPLSYLTDHDDIYAYMRFVLSFGRRLYDPDLALDPSRFRNLQLKVTHNYQAVDSAADDAYLAVYASMFDEKKIAPMGYLRPVEVQTYTSGAESSVETIDLDRNLPIRTMLIRGSASDYLPWQVVHDVKIEENGGAKVPFDLPMSDWLKDINARYGIVRQPAFLAVNATARDIYCMPTMEVDVSLMPSTVTNIISREASLTGIPFKLDITASDEAQGVFEGFCPHACFPIPFGDPEDPADWYDPTTLGSLKAKLTAGSAGTNGTVAVVLEQLKKY